MRYILATTLILFAAGCGQKSDDNGPPPEQVKPAEPTEPAEPAKPAGEAKTGETPTAPSDGAPKDGTATVAGEGEGAVAVAPEKARLGELAPDFALTGTDGETWKLSDHRGKVVVLEWFNPGCPFVKYAYGDGPLSDLAKKTVSDEVVWVNINSGAPGKQGHGLETNKTAKSDWGIEHPVLMDEDGAVGRKYEAKTTPEMYVVDKDGKLVYRGALDNAPLGRVDGDGEVVNYVTSALADLAAGNPVATPETVSYGCSVKY